MALKIKRVYDAPAKSDGHRILVDRLWPRGRKSEAQIDEWLRDIAPSTSSRKWFGHEPERWEQFKKKYAAELEERRQQLEKIARKSRKRTITLLFGTKNTACNNARALKEYVEKLT